MGKYDDKVKADCVAEVKKGTPLAQITQKLGPNPEAIKRYCKAAGVTIPKATPKPAAPKAAPVQPAKKF